MELWTNDADSEDDDDSEDDVGDFIEYCHLQTSDCEKLKIQISCSSILFVPAHVTWHLMLHHNDDDDDE